MSEQDGTQSSTKRRRSSKTSSSKQVPVAQHPVTDDREGWEAFWKERGQPWRTEPEINKERQQDLEKCLATIPMGREKDILFFNGFQLNRADIEWLLATQKKPDRIVYFYSENEQRQRRESLTLCGADLHKINLSGLPMEQVNLLEANLEGANLRGAHLEEAILIRAHLEGADLTGVYLEGAYLGEAHLEGVSIFKAHLGKATLNGSHLERTNLFMTHLQEAYLVGAHLEGADLRFTHLEGARLMQAHLEEANLEYAHLEGANLTESYLEGAILCNAFFDRATALNNITLGSNKRRVFARLADLSWGDANLAVVDWSGITMLGDEHVSRISKEEIGQKKNARRKAIKTERNLAIKKRLRDEDKLQSTAETAELIKKFQAAIRANRQLASALQTQGMNEDATKFAYNAQVLRTQMLLEQITAHQTQITLSIFIVFVLLLTIFFLVNISFLIDQLNCRSIYESSSACPNGTLSIVSHRA